MPNRPGPKAYQALARRLTHLEQAVFGDDGGGDTGEPPPPRPPETTLPGLDERVKRLETDPVTREEFEVLSGQVHKLMRAIAVRGGAPA